MDLLKYLEPMKNLPERFSNLAFWRGVRKLRDEVVNAFEYVDSWGEHVESQLDNIPYHNEYPYQLLKEDSRYGYSPISLVFDVISYIEHYSLNDATVPDTYVFNIPTDTSITFTSSHYFKPENLYIRGIHLAVTLSPTNAPNVVYKHWNIFTNANFKDYVLNTDGRITGFEVREVKDVFTLPGIDSDIASGYIMHVQLSFDAFGKTAFPT